MLDTDKGHDPDASIEDGAVLYRITSRTYCGRNEILTGDGAALGVDEGRFHRVKQRTTYSANNIIICLSEILYRMYRAMLDSIKDKLPAADLKQRALRRQVLVILTVGKIDNLIYADSIGARVYNSNITGPSITCPDSVYSPLQDFSDAVRKDNKSGVVYPSARHSEGLAFALFNDETQSVKPTPYETLELQMQLVSESQDFLIRPPSKFDIHGDKLHPTIGYYEFKDPLAFSDLKSKHLIWPEALSDKGYVDFVRRRYDKATYPVTAHMPC